jgi:hypothetical protein
VPVGNNARERLVLNRGEGLKKHLVRFISLLAAGVVGAGVSGCAEQEPVSTLTYRSRAAAGVKGTRRVHLEGIDRE